MNFRGDRPPLLATMIGLVAASTLAASGCKTSGTSSSLAWWPGGSKSSSENEKLASAPSFDGTVSKPSETQSPYPTTTTPQSYALDAKASSQVASGPPAASAPLAAASAPPAPVTAGGVAAQVGPYQGWPAGGSPPVAGSPPAAGSSVAAAPAATVSPTPSPTPSSSAALGFGSASSMASDGVEPPARYADNRFGDARFGDAPAAAADVGGNPASRYSSSGSSQFGADPSASPGPPAAVAPASSPAAFPAVPATPAASAVDPSAFLPPSGANRLRGPAASAGPSTPPARRPDPGYRPGGTSTYRASQAIIDEPAETGAAPVRQASFASPLR